MATTFDQQAHQLLTLGARKSLWNTTAPKRVNQHCEPGEEGKGWDAWAAHLAERRSPAPHARLFEGRSVPLTWCLPEPMAPAEIRDEIEVFAGNRNTGGLTARLESWLTRDARNLARAADGLLAIAVAHALPRAAQVVPPSLWWNVLDRLLRLGSEVDAGVFEHEDPPEQTLSSLLFTGELPLTLAYQFPELRPCWKLRKKAKESLSASLVELCDGEGILPFRLIPVHRLLDATWARCLGMAKAMEIRCFSGDALAQLEWRVRQTIRFARVDGSLMLTDAANGVGFDDLEMLTELIRLAGDESDAAAASKSLGRRVGASFPDADSAEPPETSCHSEWAELSLLRTDWRRRAPRVAVGTSGATMRVELESGGETLLHGDWVVDLRIAGERVPFDGDWEEVCWTSDDDVDYAEFSIDIDGGGKIERQIILAREDLFLMLVDNVRDVGAGGIDYRSRTPLGSGVDWAPKKETREGFLVGAQPLANVLPLALPEWRVDDRGGRLGELSDALVLEQNCPGVAMCCPLFIDLRPRRFQTEVTWRRLTVAESLEIQPNDVAVGFRIQLGNRQWLYYRSLGVHGNRTLLGQNFSSEFYLGRFLSDGSVDEIIEIEASDA